MAVTQEQLEADKAAVAAAQAKLDEDQAAFDAVQPHLSVLGEISAFVDKLPEEAKADFAGLIIKAKSLF